jgi:hypothetical protein|tara:strand:+ start:249 stop:842 length:594 start_codon:yes stop_codon:yes gene_type:complete
MNAIALTLVHVVAVSVIVTVVNTKHYTNQTMLKDIIGGIANLWTRDNDIPKEPKIFNNPGNIEIGQGYAGETGDTYADRFAVFDSPQMGVRALGRDIKTKINRFDGDLQSIINQYAPPNENDTNNYFEYVKEQVGSDTITESDLGAVVRAIITMENKPEIAAQYLNDSVFNEGLKLAQMSFDQGVTLDEARKLLRKG